MTGPEHYTEAERIAAHAASIYQTDDCPPGPRGEYASDAEWQAALEESNAAYEQTVREMAAFAQLAQVHAILAQAAAHGAAPDPQSVEVGPDLPDGTPLPTRTPWGTALAHTLRTRPGSWHLLERAEAPTRLMRRRRGDVDAGRAGWGPPGDFEAVLLLVGGEAHLYARHVDHHAPTAEEVDQ